MTALPDFAAVVGDAHVLTTADKTDAYSIDERELYHGQPAAVVRPGTRNELAQVVTLCHEARVAMVPQGGNTGYCGGATPDQSGSEVVISLERLSRVINVDRASATLTVEAGVVLAKAQTAAAEHNLLLPLSMGSQGSCQVGGNLATNAGGLAVLRYGTARDLTLGLEVVLPDGRVISDLAGLRKDNTGYDLKQLFIGAEGTLGIISAATLKLFPRVHAPQTVFAAVADVTAACTLLASMRDTLGDNVSSFEYMSSQALDCVIANAADQRRPLAIRYAHYVLVEWAEFGEPRSAAEIIGDVLNQAFESGLILDAVVAQNEAHRRALWQLREGVPAAEKSLGGSIKHDIAVRLADVPEYIARATASLLGRWPNLRLSVYGHIGDGNVHFNVLAAEADDAAAFRREHADAVSDCVHDIAHAMGGSFSAEHGVGKLKRDLLDRYSNDAQLELMRTIKAALDPHNLMNPGKLL